MLPKTPLLRTLCNIALIGNIACAHAEPLNEPDQTDAGAETMQELDAGVDIPDSCDLNACFHNCQPTTSEEAAHCYQKCIERGGCL